MPCPDGLTQGFGLSSDQANSICFVKSYFGIGPDGLGLYRSGSAMLFVGKSARQHVVTAGHNLYDHRVRRFARWVSLYFARDGGSSVATRDGIAMFVPDAFRQASTPDPAHDFGIVRINPLGGDRFTPIPLAISTATGPTEKLLVGYPDDGPCKERARPFHARFDVAPAGERTYRYFDQRTYVGLSGAPLLTLGAGESGLRSFGLHIRGEENPDRAVRFVPEVHDAIMAWT